MTVSLCWHNNSNYG